MNVTALRAVKSDPLPAAQHKAALGMRLRCACVRRSGQRAVHHEATGTRNIAQNFQSSERERERVAVVADK